MPCAIILHSLTTLLLWTLGLRHSDRIARVLPLKEALIRFGLPTHLLSPPWPKDHCHFMAPSSGTYITPAVGLDRNLALLRVL